MEIETIIGDVDAIEKIVVSQEPSEIGRVPYTAYLTIIDDSSDDVVFLLSQVDDIIDALNEAKVAWHQAKAKR